ncbi:DUF2294 domain-containing protein [Cohnella caldifontis]|uniref:DUF2294 domain-containing protein n=1 Tax=Cohnella caldifontis TaxID=3027471 RepID=UPI0023ECE9DE|nr:DUF2294 domain-containing protein [Cohnella sp. YIM B05605]
MTLLRGNLTNEAKKLLTRIYNEVNKEIYGFGVTRLKIAENDGAISVYVKHQRVAALKALESRYGLMKQAVDYALHSEFKIRFHRKLEEDMGLQATAILRDYDPATEWAVTVVMLEP